MIKRVSIVAFAALWSFSNATVYQITKDYSGSSFFDDWTFFNNPDTLTNGNVQYVSASQGASDKLAYVNDAGHAIMKVDNTSQVSFNDNRNSVRITTNDRYAVGSLWLVDMVHVPFGCSVWPAWWSEAPDWPTGGEIDTFEGVNQVTYNQMSLHTEPGCSQVNATQTSTSINSTDCDFQANNNEGCAVFDLRTDSYGQQFADAGGGMFITEFAESGISVWYFNRSSIPSSLSSNASSFDTADLGTPVSNWPTDGCNIDQFFEPQSLIFDITLCGDFAGNTGTFAQTCLGFCYEDWVLGSPSNYDDAYFEVSFMRVFNNGTDRTIVGVSNTAGRRPFAGVWIITVVMIILGVGVAHAL